MRYIDSLHLQSVSVIEALQSVRGAAFPPRISYDPIQVLSKVLLWQKPSFTLP